MTYPFEIIRWEDHCSGSAWKNLDELKALPMSTVTTAGWVVHEDETRLIVCNSIQDDDEETLGEYGGYDILLKATIIDRQEYDL